MSAAERPAGAPKRVLIVDDERNDRDLLEVMLAPGGYELVTASNGERALRVTAEEQPDLILLDVTMPGMDGYQVVAKLKADPATSNIPVIMVTALGDRSARMAGLNAGAEDFLSKPVDRAELQARVSNLLRLKAYSDYHRKHGLMLEGEVTARTAELIESEKRYRQIVESTTDGIAKLDLTGAILFANGRFASMLGYEPPQMVGENALALLGIPAQTIGGPGLPSRASAIAETHELSLRRKDGAALAVSLACTPIVGDRGEHAGVLVSARDVTERNELMAQLTVSDRMASLGTLAAGVAHEINNPLACVLANLDLAAAQVIERSGRLGLALELGEVTEQLRDAREASTRIRNIVRDLSIFSRSQEDEACPTDVEKVMESTLRIACNSIRHSARIVKSYGKIGLVHASESRLGQVFLNLVINAAQAIEEGRAGDNEIRISTRADASGAVVIEIADTGPGISAEVLSRLFTPFFTTKPVGVGTGLGLSICHRIVDSFGGSIGVTSELGKGTVFRVTLPAARAEAAEAPPEVALDVAARRRGRVLIIDDEPMIAKAVERTICEDHDVHAVEGAREALERIVAGERFDVILCDLMMPEMTGMMLHAGLTRVAQEQADRMIFLSGGAFTPQARAFLHDPAIHRVEKPFDIRRLRSMINDRIR
jgi:PAS domain S-box-containing protein